MTINAQQIENYPLGQTPAIGEKKMTWILAEFEGEKMPDNIMDRLRGTTKTFNEYISMVSRDLLKVTSTYSPVYKINGADATNASSIAEKHEIMMKYAKDNGFDVDGSYIIYVIASEDLRGYGGTGSGNGSTGASTLGAANIWIPGSVHEMLHMFSVGHAEAIDGGDKVFPGDNVGGLDPYFFLGSEGPDGKDCPYGTDQCEIYFTLSLPHKGRVGWIKEGEVEVSQNIGEAKTFRIYNHDIADRSGTQKLGVYLTDYFGEGLFSISYVKNALGRRTNNGGILVHYVPYVSPAVSRLLDLTPNSITSNTEQPGNVTFDHLYDFGDSALGEGKSGTVNDLFTIEVLKETKVGDKNYYVDFKITPIACPTNYSFALEEFEYNNITGTQCDPELVESWNITNDRKDQVALNNNSLSYSGLSAKGKSLQIKPKNNSSFSFSRRLKEGYTSGSTMWLSYLLKPNKLGNGHFFISPSDNLEAAIGKKWGRSFAINNSSKNTKEALEGDTFLLVAKYELKKNENDNIFLWVNPDITVTPNINNTVAERIGEVDFNNGINVISVNYSGYGSGDYTVDRISVSDTFKGLFTAKSLRIDDITEPEEANAIKIYPSPADNEIYVSTGTDRSIKNIEIYNITGNRIKTVTSRENLTQIDINDLATGVYFVKVKQKDRLIKVFKIIKS
ncbi:hypothetical protein A8C32_10260 [Flavivirga aquatica]|uniref:Secretion system C-terminal sorting domain-containing protein n=2 Tax=Flavivirga aquatica TaxID=1849968 RepID=A0A1E5TET3_9FLAO|nr:hypothetical protein A8C32_10260 [Flavivirga aquatica]